MEFNLDLDLNDYQIPETYNIDYAGEDASIIDFENDYPDIVDDKTRFSCIPEIKLSANSGYFNDELVDTFAYFDKSMNRNWAGPQFWRAKVIMKGQLV
jgi:hypothetical protein